ncbi:MAG: hypothetical protein COA67_12210 [Lutibacter sp.]|nr:MAG: hypothetical protein COA67_12210 [Lutibacter sp.]
MKNLIKITVLTLLFISCKSVENEDTSTYFGGQIVNPKDNFITLMKGEKALDTIYLNKDNTFSKRLDYIKEGLYSFTHGSVTQGYEYQYIYFEPKDSIVIRLNTWDFDESLVFSGKGAEKNNFLITLYLQNEKEGKLFGPYYNLKPTEFLTKTATITSLNQHIYNQLKGSGVELTEKFNELAKVTVDYPIYIKKEVYPFIHKKRFQLDSFPSLPSTYYDFRKGIDLNNSDLIDYSPYHNYVNNYLYNLSYKESAKKTTATENILNVIVTKIKIPEFKNRLLYQAIYNDFRGNKNSCCINDSALQIFNEHCTDEKLLERINYLANDCKNSKDQHPIEDFELLTLNNSKTRLKTIIKNKKSVVYFWSPEIMSSKMLIKRITGLEKKHPSIKFVGINMHPSSNDARVNKFLKNQFTLSKESIGNKLIKSMEPRTILIDKNGIVANSFTYLSSQYLEKQLLALEQND